MKKTVALFITILLVIQTLCVTVFAEDVPSKVTDARNSVVKFQADHYVAVDAYGKGYDSLGYVYWVQLSDGEIICAINVPTSHVLAEFATVGTGFAIGKEGESVDTIVTAAHCLGNETRELYVFIEDSGYKYVGEYELKPSRFCCVFGSDVLIEGDLVTKSDDCDFAIMKLKNTISRTPIKINTGNHLEVGKSVYALGFPQASESYTQQYYTVEDVVVTTGNVTKYGQMELVNSGKAVDCYTVNAVISGGNSGGPLVDENGVCIGINVQSVVGEEVHDSVDIKKLVTVLNELGIAFEDGATATATATAEPSSTTTSGKASTTSGGSGGGFGSALVALIVVAIIAAVIVVIILVSKKNKPRPAAAAYAPNSAPMPNHAPMQNPNARVNFGNGAAAPNMGGGFKMGAGETTVLSQSNGPRLIRKNNGETIPISGNEFSIGREYGSVNYCVGNSNNISRKHAIFYMNNGSYCVVDNNTSNGTYINGTRMNPGQAYLLNSGDILRLADEDFEYRV